MKPAWTIPRPSIDIPPGNPRSAMDATRLGELVDSIRQHGILQPVLVRPAGDRFELICGHRRLAAADEVGLTEIPAQVRDVDDHAMLQIRLEENLQREDINPLDEGDAYHQLVDKLGHTVSEVAARVGRSQAHVYGRMKLAEMPQAAREGLRAGKFSLSIAMLIARIPSAALATKAAKEFSKPRRWDDAWTASKARGWIEYECMRALKEAPFKLSDAELVPAAGSCSECPKRSGAQPDLFGEAERKDDLCLDPTCFKKKVDAAFRAKAKEVKAGGGRQLTAAERKAAVKSWGLQLVDTGLVELDHANWDDPKGRTWRQLLGQEKPAIVLAKDPRTGAPVELVDKKAAMTVVRKKHDFATRTSPRSLSPAERKRREDSAIANAVTHRALAQVAEHVELRGDLSELWPTLARILVHASWSDTCRQIANRRFPERNKKDDPSGVTHLCQWIGKASTGQILGLVAELGAARAASGYGDGPEWKALAKACGVNFATIRAAVKKDRTATRKAKPKPGKES